MMLGLRPSRWIYDTASTANVGLGAFLVGGGTIYLDDPAGEQQKFHYGASGMGFGMLKKIPKIPEIELPMLSLRGNDLSGTGAASTFSATGAVYMTSAFNGEELRRTNLMGSTICFDLGAGFIADGGTYTAMLLGINTALLEMGIMLPQFNYSTAAIHSAPAVLVMRGFNVGTQPGTLQGGVLRAGIGFGGDVMFGHLS